MNISSVLYDAYASKISIVVNHTFSAKRDQEKPSKFVLDLGRQRVYRSIGREPGD